MTQVDLAAPLLEWYARQARQLPWRDHPDPYAVWVSEIMLQQTRVETVQPYFANWMAQFPDIESLAKADLQQVLSAWQGLGYYSRARNLHRAAQIVVEKWGGKLPPDPHALRSLPGVGRYTAAAIASIAFGLDEATLDGNIQRVFSRLFNFTEVARSPAAEKRLWQLVSAHLPPGKASQYNQALMDLGALICTPRAPACDICPLAHVCQARALGVQEQRPIQKIKPPIPHYLVTAAVIQQAGKVLITQRPQDGLLGGMWEFPGGKQGAGEDLAQCLQREICEELGAEIAVHTQLGIYRHAYTHFRVTLHAFHCTLLPGAQPRPLQVADLLWVDLGELQNYPMGKIDRLIAADLQPPASHRPPVQASLPIPTQVFPC